MTEQRFAIFGALERAVMDIVWDNGTVSVRTVVDALAQTRRPAYTTVMTVMNRLVEKNLLRRRADGQSYQYSTTMNRQQFLEQSSRQVVATFVRDFGELAVAEFIDALDHVSPHKVASLRRKLRRSK